MQRLKISMLLISVLLASCAIAPNVRPSQVCPKIPEVETLGEDVLGPSFIETMQRLLLPNSDAQK